MWRDRQGRTHLSAEEARGGEIVLRTPARRAIFLGGLIGALAVGIAVIFAA
jgi:hypothetical protein